MREIWHISICMLMSFRSNLKIETARCKNKCQTLWINYVSFANQSVTYLDLLRNANFIRSSYFCIFVTLLDDEFYPWILRFRFSDSIPNSRGHLAIINESYTITRSKTFYIKDSSFRRKYRRYCLAYWFNDKLSNYRVKFSN